MRPRLIPCSEGNPARPDRLLPEPLLRGDSLLIACSEAIADRSRVPVTVPQRPPVDIGRLGGPRNGTPHYRRAGVDFLVQEIPRKRSRQFSPSIAKQALEASRCQLGVTHRMLDRLVAEQRLDRGTDAPAAVAAAKARRVSAMMNLPYL
jgi:hypothetical protein